MARGASAAPPRIFIGEKAKYKGEPLYETILMKAREAHFAGAGALRRAIGFRQSSGLHASKTLRLSEDSPLVIEIVDNEEKIRDFLSFLDEIKLGELVMLEKVQVLQYGDGVRHEQR